MSCPWRKIETPKAVNLKEIISEEKARDWQKKDKVRVLRGQGGSKMSIPNENDEKAPQNYDFISDSEEDEIENKIDKKYWSQFEEIQPVVNKKNASKLLSFVPEFQAGDEENFDLELFNQVFNSPKPLTVKEQIKLYQLERKHYKPPPVFSLDDFTKILLHQMLKSRLLEKINGVISVGEKGVVIHGKINPSFSLAKEPLPAEVAIKAFRRNLTELEQRDQLVEDDHNHKGKQPERKNIKFWAKNEKESLIRLKTAGLNCPDVITLKHNLLVMSFIGENNRAAPKLEDAKDVDYVKAYDEIAKGMKALYNKANLIHGDLSEDNILWHNKQCYFIGLSQSVEPIDLDAFHLLHTDCCNVIRFFTRKGVPNLPTPETLYKEITGFEYGNKLAESAVVDSFKMNKTSQDKLRR